MIFHHKWLQEMMIKSGENETAISKIIFPIVVQRQNDFCTNIFKVLQFKDKVLFYYK